MFQSPKIGSVVSNLILIVRKQVKKILFQSPKIGSVVSNLILIVRKQVKKILFQSPKIGSVVSNFGQNQQIDIFTYDVSIP